MSGKSAAKRHKIVRENILGITKPAIRRLCRRGGVKRISGLIYEEVRRVLKKFLQDVLKDAVVYTEHARRKTLTAMDVVYALKQHNITLYGFHPTGYYTAANPRRKFNAREEESPQPPKPPAQPHPKTKAALEEPAQESERIGEQKSRREREAERKRLEEQQGQDLHGQIVKEISTMNLAQLRMYYQQLKQKYPNYIGSADLAQFAIQHERPDLGLESTNETQPKKRASPQPKKPSKSPRGLIQWLDVNGGLSSADFTRDYLEGKTLPHVQKLLKDSILPRLVQEEKKPQDQAARQEIAHLEDLQDYTNQYIAQLQQGLSPKRESPKKQPTPKTTPKKEAPKKRARPIISMFPAAERQPRIEWWTELSKDTSRSQPALHILTLLHNGKYKDTDVFTSQQKEAIVKNVQLMKQVADIAKTNHLTYGWHDLSENEHEFVILYDTQRKDREQKELEREQQRLQQEAESKRMAEAKKQDEQITATRLASLARIQRQQDEALKRQASFETRIKKRPAALLSDEELERKEEEKKAAEKEAKKERQEQRKRETADRQRRQKEEEKKAAALKAQLDEEKAKHAADATRLRDEEKRRKEEEAKRKKDEKDKAEKAKKDKENAERDQRRKEAEQAAKEKAEADKRQRAAEAAERKRVDADAKAEEERQQEAARLKQEHEAKLKRERETRERNEAAAREQKEAEQKVQQERKENERKEREAKEKEERERQKREEKERKERQNREEKDRKEAADREAKERQHAAERLKQEAEAKQAREEERQQAVAKLKREREAQDEAKKPKHSQVIQDKDGDGVYISEYHPHGPYDKNVGEITDKQKASWISMCNLPLPSGNNIIFDSWDEIMKKGKYSPLVGDQYESPVRIYLATAIDKGKITSTPLGLIVVVPAPSEYREHNESEKEKATIEQQSRKQFLGEEGLEILYLCTNTTTTVSGKKQTTAQYLMAIRYRR